MENNQINSKIAKIEALFAGTDSIGEKHAATAALERLLNKLHGDQSKEDIIEHKFTGLTPHSKKLFISLLKRYGLEPYRYYRQKWTTVMVKGPDNFITNIIWPEFLELDKLLTEHLDSVTEKLISQNICSDTSEEKEIQQIENKT